MRAQKLYHPDFGENPGVSEWKIGMAGDGSELIKNLTMDHNKYSMVHR
jgi:hypothetical protein